MDSTWGQLLLGLATIAGFFAAVAAGVALFLWAPLTGPPTIMTRRGGVALRLRLWRHVARAAERLRTVRLPAPAARSVERVARRPARLVVAGFAVAVMAGWALLMLPAATESGRGAGAVTALFTATSAVCVTGLVIVDTGAYWSGFGEAVIPGLIQIGGFGIMTMASLLGLLVAGRQHATILRRVGAHHVVLPEQEMGERMAHLVTGRILDFIQFDDDYVLAETVAPAVTIDRTLADAEVRSAYGVTVMSIKRPGEPFTHVTAGTTVYAGDVLIVAGDPRSVRTFCTPH